MDNNCASALFNYIHSAFKFSELGASIAEVGSEDEVFVRMIQVVRKDLEESERLLLLPSVQRSLSKTPGKRPWITASLQNTRICLNGIGKWIEHPRELEEAGGVVPHFSTRAKWAFSDQEKLMNRKLELTTCHRRLLTVLNYLVPMEVTSDIVESPAYDDSISYNDIIAPRQRWKLKSNRTNLNHLRTSQEASAVELEDKTAPINIGKIATNSVFSTSEPSLMISPQSKIHSHSRSMSELFICPLLPAPREIVELDGVLLDATNHLGPVNPFEFANNVSPAVKQSFPQYHPYHSPRPIRTLEPKKPVTIPLTPTQATPELSRRNPEALAEIMGDLYFPSEAPTLLPCPKFRRNTMPDALTRMPKRKPVPQRATYHSASEIKMLSMSALGSRTNIARMSESPSASRSTLSSPSPTSQNNVSEPDKTLAGSFTYPTSSKSSPISPSNVCEPVLTPVSAPTDLVPPQRSSVYHASHAVAQSSVSLSSSDLPNKNMSTPAQTLASSSTDLPQRSLDSPCSSERQNAEQNQGAPQNLQAVKAHDITRNEHTAQKQDTKHNRKVEEASKSHPASNKHGVTEFTSSFAPGTLASNTKAMDVVIAPKPASAAAARMQRQKSLLELLGTLD